MTNYLIKRETERLILRQWRSTDFEPFARMSASPEVMAFFPSTLTQAQSDEGARRCQSLIAQHGWGFWAVEEKASGQFIGFTGLHHTKECLPFPPTVEIGWRLAPAFWRKGYATEAAKEALHVGFEILNLNEIVSFAVVSNVKSRAVMERLGMVEEGWTFEHPEVPVGHSLREHCFYRS